MATEKVVKRIHLMQVSLQRTDPLNQVEADMKYAFAQEPEVIGFTEIVGSEMRQRFNKVCRENNYVPVVPNGTGLTVPLAVRIGGDGNPKVKDKGCKLALDGVAGKYENRYISWARIKWHDQDIYVHEGHWSRTKNGVDKHTTVSTMMAGQVKKHGQGDAISFWMGDLNIDDLDDDRPTHEKSADNLSRIFRENGLLSLFDELHVNPPNTLFKGTYDFIGCYRPDKQVEGKRYKVHPKQNSDHSFVSGWYDIDVSKKPRVNVGNTGTTPVVIETEILGEETTENGDWYASGGNISWDDYLNSDVYPLPYAYGDSDSHQHG